MTEHPILFSGPMVRAILAGEKTQTRRVIVPQPTKYASDWSEHLEIGDVYVEAGTNKIFKAVESTGRNKRDAGELTKKEIKCPCGVPCDQLWVRENWWDLGHVENGKWQGRIEGHTVKPLYVCDCPDPYIYNGEMGGLTNLRPRPIPWQKTSLFKSTWRKRPSIHMPRWASRIELLVKNVKVERVQESITDEYSFDVFKEGICWVCEHEGTRYSSDPMEPNEVCGGHGGVGCFADTVSLFAELWDSINAKHGYGWEKNPWVWVIEFELKKPKGRNDD